MQRAIIPRRTVWLLVLAILAGAFSAYSVLWREGPWERSDSRSYLDAASDLRDGRLDRPQLRPAGYPLLLLLTGGGQQPGAGLLLTQLALHMASVVLLAGLLIRLRASTWQVLLLAVVGCMPHLAQSSAEVLSEGLAQFLLALGFVGFCRWLLLKGSTVWLVSGACGVALAAATRPVYQSVVVALAVVALLLPFSGIYRDLVRRGGIIVAVILVSATAFVWLPSHHQRQRFGAAASLLLPLSLSDKMAAYVEALPPDHGELREILLRYRARHLVESRHHRAEGYIFRALPELREHLGDDSELARWLLEANLEIIRREPRSYLRSVGWAAMRYWFPYSTALPGMQGPVLGGLWAGVYLATVLVAALALATALGGAVVLSALADSADELRAMLVRHRQWLGCLAVAVTVVLAAMVLNIVVGVGHPRHRLPTDLLVLFLAVGWLGFLSRLRDTFRLSVIPRAATAESGGGGAP